MNPRVHRHHGRRHHVPRPHPVLLLPQEDRRLPRARLHHPERAPEQRAPEVHPRSQVMSQSPIIIISLTMMAVLRRQIKGLDPVLPNPEQAITVLEMLITAITARTPVIIDPVM